MTDQEAWEYLLEHRKVITMHMRSVISQCSDAQALATRIIVGTDSEDVRELIKMAARHLFDLEVDRR